MNDTLPPLAPKGSYPLPERTPTYFVPRANYPLPERTSHTDRPVPVAQIGSVVAHELDTGEKETSPETPPLSRDDEKLLDIMLYYDGGLVPLYPDLIERGSILYRKEWDPQKQAAARKGVRELFEAALYPRSVRGKTVEDARSELDDLKARNEVRGRGWDLGYQKDLMNLYQEGEYLHFGNNRDYPEAPDLLPSQTRVYVVPKMEAVGHVAAEVIRRSRERGYEPYGKLLDESTNMFPIDDRIDRLLVMPRTKSQLAIVMDALREINAEEPNLFESHGVLLTEETDIPAVGIAEEPPMLDGKFRSFHEVRVPLLLEAWQKTLTALMGEDKGEKGQGKFGDIDKRLADLRQMVESGQLPRMELIERFKADVRNLAPKHGVSPTHFARNLQPTEAAGS
jgi:hypothetical protein